MTRGKNLMLYLALLICGGVLATVSGGDARSQNSVEASKERPNTDKAAAKNMEGFDCGSGKPGWKRAKAITPNLVPPCNTGSGGMCEQFSSMCRVPAGVVRADGRSIGCACPKQAAHRSAWFARSVARDTSCFGPNLSS